MTVRTKRPPRRRGRKIFLGASILLLSGLVTPVAAPAVEGEQPAESAPNDPLLAGAWRQRVPLETLRVLDAWNAGARANGVTIAVLDSGVDLDHPDLDASLLPGWDFVDDDPEPEDEGGQGTEVAGVAAASTNNGAGVAGVAWGAQILPVRVLDDELGGTPADVAAGIEWATDQGADVILVSYAEPQGSEDLEIAVQYALAADTVVVAAAGINRFEATPTFPGAYEGVVAVGATDWAGNLTYDSGHGDHVDLAAPGFDISGTRLAAGPVESYTHDSRGTPIAAAFAAGAAGLLRAGRPEATADEVSAQLIAAARDAGPAGLDPYYGHGLLDVGAAFGSPEVASSANRTPDPAEPNDTPARAGPLVKNLESSYPRWKGEGSFSLEGDVDWYAFEVPARGHRIDADFETPWVPDSVAQQTAPWGRVFGPDLRPLHPANERPWTAAAQGGTHYLQVRNVYPSRQLHPHYGYSVEVEVSSAWGSVYEEEGPLWVRDTSPAESASDVPVDVSPAVVFERKPDPTTVTASSIRLIHGSTLEAVPATIAYDAESATATLDPAADLEPGTPYRLQLDGLEDGTGAAMTRPETLRFSTAGASDTTPPETRVVSQGFAYDSHDYFVSSEPASYIECRVNRNPWRFCDFFPIPSNDARQRLTFEARAIDAAGNVDPTPFSATWVTPSMNDDFAQAMALHGASGEIAGNLSWASREPDEPLRGVQWDAPSEWYSWTAPESGRFFVDTFGSDSSATVAAYRGNDLPSLDVVGSRALHPTGWNKLAFDVQQGVTYRIVVAGGHTRWGNYRLGWDLRTNEGQPPSVALSVDDSDKILRHDVRLLADVADQDVSRVAFRINGQRVAIDEVAPYSFLWKTADAEDGEYALSVRVTDAMGHSVLTPATTVEVDNTAPTTSMQGKPPSRTASTSAAFVLSSTEASSFECLLDGARWTACDAAATFADLDEGQHTLLARAVDAAGNVDASPSRWTWVVDLIAPETNIIAGPSAYSRTSSPRFFFTASEASTFRCKLDAGPVEVCTTPRRSHLLEDLSEGPHTFSVYAVDEATNVDSSPAQVAFVVDTIAPNVKITSGPKLSTTDRTPTFTFESNDPNATLRCRLQSAASRCTSPFTSSRLRLGNHTFSVVAVDAAGNKDQSPALRKFTIKAAP